VKVNQQAKRGKLSLDDRRGKQPPMLHSAHVDAVLDQWVARLEQPIARPARPAALHPTPPSPEEIDFEGRRARSVREALSRIEVDGSTVRFTDDAGGEIVLARVGPRTVHRGTIAVRGPLGLTTKALEAHGLSENQARAVEFLVAWFGAPFDAACTQRAGSRVTLDLGAWPLSGPEIARALGLWKSRAPERFASMVGEYGIDVATNDEIAGPVLTLVDPHGAVRRGERALEAVAADARRLAVLARTGRDEVARAAQIECLVAALVLPILRTAVRRGESRVSLGDTIVSARGVAAVLCAARRVDATSFDEVMRVAITDRPADASEHDFLEATARYLRVSGHTSAAHDMRRTLSSPELHA
jgi:hypothetical protein